MPPIRGLLIDWDGVLTIQGRPIPGAAESLVALRAAGVPFRVLTNVTMRSRAELARRLADAGIPVVAGEIHTAASLAAGYLRAAGARRLQLLLRGTAVEEFAGFELADDAPEWVVVGDMGDDFTAGVMNAAYRSLLAGARLLALQHNRAWTAPDGPRLDVGAWTAALEFASRQEAVVIGKPAPAAFRLPCEEMGLPPAAVAMVTDDPDVDLAGARAAGLQTILTETTSLPARRPIAPHEYDYTIASIADLPALPGL